MARYSMACIGNTQKAMTLYRKNLKLSQELFTIISCFEVALRNAIDKHYTHIFGVNWLLNAVSPGGRFDNPNCRVTKKTIDEVLQQLGSNYSHNKLVAGLGFGFWRYHFSSHQYRVMGQSLLNIFGARPQSSLSMQYNASFIFNQLAQINKIRNRIAHHEPICFLNKHQTKDTTYARQHYSLILQLFQWMSMDEASLLYGLDHIRNVCNEIDAL